jgi:hypothetical protein
MASLVVFPMAFSVGGCAIGAAIVAVVETLDGFWTATVFGRPLGVNLKRVFSISEEWA